MKTYNNPYTRKIFEIINPLIGDLMAAGVLKTQAKKLGIDEESLTPRQIPELAERIKLGLVLFLGSDMASRVSKKISEIH
jgi:hypothetical protein